MMRHNAMGLSNHAMIFEPLEMLRHGQDSDSKVKDLQVYLGSGIGRTLPG